MLKLTPITLSLSRAGVYLNTASLGRYNYKLSPSLALGLQQVPAHRQGPPAQARNQTSPQLPWLMPRWPRRETRSLKW